MEMFIQKTEIFELKNLVTDIYGKFFEIIISIFFLLNNHR